MKAIETSYADCRFRSRLEARWAVFFDRLGIAWQYEPQGFVIGDRAYLPDFLLTDSGTWVEVKGAEGALDHDLMVNAAEALPGDGYPRLLILGPMPGSPEKGDWAWLGFSIEPGIEDALDGWWGFGTGALDCARETSCAPPYCSGDGSEWLAPALDMRPEPGRAGGAYAAARAARFEHGEKG